jgi:hypothetical protein
MRLLLDTHIWVWYLLGDSRLSTTLAKAIALLKLNKTRSPSSLSTTKQRSPFPNRTKPRSPPPILKSDHSFLLITKQRSPFPSLLLKRDRHSQTPKNSDRLFPSHSKK